MTHEIERRVESYLDGELSRAGAMAFEDDLLEEEVAQAFREALLMRELLQSAPPEGVPEGLTDRIARALRVEAKRKKRFFASGRFRTLRLIAKGAAWTFEGPAMAFAGLPGVYWGSKRRSGGGERAPSRWKRLVGLS